MVDDLQVRARQDVSGAPDRRPTAASVTRLIAADIPGSCESSDACHVVAPGGVFVVGRVGVQAAVEDADESIGELAEGGSVADLSITELLVVGLGSG
jgi:hypothetical protein